MSEVHEIDSQKNIKRSAGDWLLTRVFILLTADAVALALSWFGAFVIRYSDRRLLGELSHALPYMPMVVIAGLAVFALMRMYRTLWRYASVDAVMIIGYGTLAAVAVPALMMVVWGRYVPHWSVWVVQWMLLVLVVGGGRFSIRLIRHLQAPERGQSRSRVLIYGAGDAGEMIARDILRAREQRFDLIGFIDDDPYKRGKSMHGLPILGGVRQVQHIIESKRVDEILVAMPSVPGVQMREILNHLHSVLSPKVQLKTLPGISELIRDTVTLQHLRQFNVRDLLRRAPVELDRTRVERLVRNKTVLITGAGGSIGTEICRQVGVCNPKKLVLFDISEPNLYTVRESLEELFPYLELIPIVGDICHRRLVKRVFEDHKPGIVFHAAAYKHVPLMELNPWSAVFNNVSGTRVLVSAAAEHNVERFVMISTDKAVRPTSVMGATKRLCEMIVQMQPDHHDGVYCVVRFGNVMGSSGSVIPKFEEQIRKGGPITVTHPEVTRYFMLTSEAVQLVLQASTLVKSGAVYILDMGEPIKIVDLAQDMIQLSGLEPGNQVKIAFTGLRPGEKLHEELYHTGTGFKTDIDKIWVTDAPVSSVQRFGEELDELLESCYSLSRDQLINALTSLVTDFNCETRGTVLRTQPIGTNGNRSKSRHAAS